MDSITIEDAVDFGGGNKKVKASLATPESTKGRVPRVARMMALAIRIDGLVSQGIVTDYADAARLGHVSRARVTQIMSLLRLAPDIQEAILFLPSIMEGRDPLNERVLRQISERIDWNEQRRMWRKLLLN